MSIYLITLLNVLNGVSLRGSRVLLSLFAIHLGAGAFEIGILISLSSIFQLFLGIYAGRVSDRYGFRLPMLFLFPVLLTCCFHSFRTRGSSP